jgi:hypothetical protein
LAYGQNERPSPLTVTVKWQLTGSKPGMPAPLEKIDINNKNHSNYSNEVNDIFLSDFCLLERSPTGEFLPEKPGFFRFPGP